MTAQFVEGKMTCNFRGTDLPIKALYRPETRTLVALAVSYVPESGQFSTGFPGDYSIAAKAIQAAHDDAMGDPSIYGFTRTELIPDWAHDQLRFEFVESAARAHFMGLVNVLDQYEALAGQQPNEETVNFVRRAAAADFVSALQGTAILQNIMDNITGHPNTIPASDPVTVYHATDLMSLASISSQGLRPGSFVTTIPELADYYAETVEDEGKTPVVLTMSVRQSPDFWLPDNEGIEEPISGVLRDAMPGFNEQALDGRWNESGKSGLDSLAFIGSAKISRAITKEFIQVDVDGESMALGDYLAMQGMHCFDDSTDAYDMSQCDESIEPGHCLVVLSEGVVGIADTWPIAVTKNAGNLHSAEEGFDPIAGRSISTEQVELAKSVALAHGFELADWTMTKAPTTKAGMSPR